MPPKVSIIVPCYNEQSTIRLLLDALLQQTFPRAEMEVIIADGLSCDGTREAIAAFQTDFPDLDVRVVDNSRRSIPSAVNCAIEDSRGEIIVRLDAHSKPYPDYVQNCVNALEQERGDTIGGVWEIQPGAQTWIASSIAVAAAHPLGVGDAFYRHTKVAAEVDTVPFGSFRRSLVDRVGYFDESLLTNEDYEFYARVRKAGGRIWLDPAIRSVYFARSTLGQLARQYRRYGFWKWRMLRRYPKTLRWRQALPPLFVLSVILLGFASIFIPFLSILLALELLLYFSIVLYAGLRAALRQRKAYLFPGLLLTIPIMHVSWGVGFCGVSSRRVSKSMAENIRTAPLRLRPSEHRTILVVGDLITGSISVFAALFTWRQYNLSVGLANLLAEGIAPGPAQRLVEQMNIEVPFWFYLLPIIWMLLLVELYEPHAASSARRTMRGIAIAAFVGIAAYSLVFIIRQDPTDLPRIGVGAFLLYASILTLTWRMLFIRIYRTTGQRRRILLIGAGKAGQTLAELYQTEGTRSFHIIGFIDDDLQKVGKKIQGLPVVGSSKQLLHMIDAYRISDLVVAINGEIRGATFQAILDAQEKGVDVTRMPILYEEMTSRVPVHHLESDWIIRSFVDELHVSGFYDLFKRVVDILGGAAGLLIFAISFPFLGLAVALDSGFPILYSQPRLGRGGLVFTIYKFRTMNQDAEADNGARTTSENDPRVTRVGSFLRKSRLDELPQFWNVLRGEMSLVGPRAEIPELVADYQKQIPFYRARLLVKPGLTGWAQINYGYVASVTETAVKLEYDLYYIKHRTFTMDFQIILRTIGTVLRRTGR